MATHMVRLDVIVHRGNTRGMPTFDDWYLGPHGDVFEKTTQAFGSYVSLELSQHWSEGAPQLALVPLFALGDQLWEQGMPFVETVGAELLALAKELNLRLEGGEPLPETLDFSVSLKASLPALTPLEADFTWSNLEEPFADPLTSMDLPFGGDGDAIRAALRELQKPTRLDGEE